MGDISWTTCRPTHHDAQVPGYELTKVQVGNVITQDLALKPFQVKALYMTANAASYAPLYNKMLEIADTTEINAVVLNVQTDPADCRL